MKTFIVESSWGELIINEEGDILELQHLEPDCLGEVNYLPFITKFNTDKWKFVNGTEELPESFDILELDYWWAYDKELGYKNSNEYYRHLNN
jgi:hypothetical protein